jgi:hypothetical protein
VIASAWQVIVSVIVGIYRWFHPAHQAKRFMSNEEKAPWK